MHPTVRSNSRYSRIRSRPQSQTNIEGIQEADEGGAAGLDKLDSHSPSDLNRIKLEMTGEVNYQLKTEGLLNYKNIFLKETR